MSEVVDILVVDDERINLKLIEGILRGENINLVSASNGQEALQELEYHDFAVALLDVMMPGMDGFELAERIRGIEGARTLPIIFITAISKEQRHVFRGYELGAVDYLFKPVEPEILRGKVGIFAELHRKKRALQDMTRQLEESIMELEQSREELEQSEKRYRMVADYNHDWESWIDPEGNPIYVSPACKRISGYSAKRFLMDPEFIQRIIHKDDLSLWHNYMSDQTLGDDVGIDFRIHHKDARVRWVSLVKHHIEDDDGTPLGVRTNLRDVTSRRKMEEQLRHSSLHDPLTGLPNRQLFMDRVGRAIDRSSRNNAYFAIVFINLDRFQVVNDSYGHMMGDTVLVNIGVRLQSQLRPDDTVGRFGGDEFVVLLENIPRKSDLTELVNQLRGAFEQPMEIEGVKFPMTASIGYDIAAGDSQEGAGILHNAQLAMYKAKERGKNRSIRYNAKMRDGVINVLAIENDVQRALGANEFEVYYQPIIKLADGVISGFEALVRWNHPTRGMVSPGEFIPVAEESGLIVELGRQVLNQACLQLVQWRELYPGAEYLTMSVNISAKQFDDESLVKSVQDILTQSKLPPDRLKLEVTETVVMTDAVVSSTRLNYLKSLGVLLSIDDFGTGYSSMSYLQRFPMDQLKVDLSFVRRIEQSPEDIEIIRAIVNMAHSLRLRVVAEGIETERQRDLLYSLQCDYGQGYLYAKPLPAQEVVRLIEESVSIDRKSNVAKEVFAS